MNEVAQSPARASRHRVRRTFTWVLVVLAALLVGLASVAVWASRTVFNEDRFNATVTDVVSDQEVIAAASSYLTDQVQVAVEASGVLDRVPPAIQPVVPLLRGAVRSRVEEAVNAVLASDSGQRLLVGAADIAHSRAVRILEGGGLLSSDAFSVENGTVTLNLVPVIRQALIRLQLEGLIPASISIPTDASEPGPIASALGSRLPADFGQIVVYQTDAVSNDRLVDVAQRGFALAKRAVVLLVLLALVVAAAAIIVAVDRRQALFRLGVAVTFAAILLIIVARRTSVAVAGAPQTPRARVIADALATSLRSSLVRALVVVAIVAAVMAIVARYGNQLAAWSTRHQELATIGVVAVGLVLLLVLGISWASVLFAAVVVIAGVLAVRRGSWSSASRTPTA